MAMEMLMDAASVQDVYVNAASFEDLGDGNMRVIRYAKHNGAVIPVSYVTSASAMIRDAQAAIDFARNILQEHLGGVH